MRQGHRHRLSLRVRRAALTAALAIGGFGYAAVALPTHALAAPTLYAAVTAQGSHDCSSAANACTLTSALSAATSGATIDLVTNGLGGTHYNGHFTVATDVTIQPALSFPPVLPVLDGTSTGTVLTVGAGVHLTLTGVTVENGSAVNGAGIFNESGGTLTITNDDFLDNIATGGGGAIDNGDNGTGTLTVLRSSFESNQAVNGGAIDVGDNGNATATITDSTFDSNTATGGGGAIADGDNGHGTVTVSGSLFHANQATLNGGALDVGDNGTTATLTVSDSTFDSNTAGARGGAIDNADNTGHGTVTATAATFVGNTATTAGNAIRNSSSHATTTVSGDLFADTCDTATGTLTDNGYNAATDASCLHSGTHNATQTAIGALIHPLAANGGPTETRGLNIGNAALGLIPQSTAGLCPTTDQRGIASAAGLPCNAGAAQIADQLPRFALPHSVRAGTQFVVSVTVSTGRPITVAVAPSSAAQCVLSGTVVRLLAPGSCRLNASVAATQNFYASSSFVVYTVVPSATGGAVIAPPIGITATTDGNSYWLSGSDGGVFAFGNARFFGSVPQHGITVHDVVGIAATPDGGGYWLAAADGGVFTFGDARYEGSLPGLGVHVSNVVGIAAVPGGAGYWLVARDGAVFSFGSARYHGSVPGLGTPVTDAVAMAPAPDGGGYWIVTDTGAVYSFGDAHGVGALPALGVQVSNVVGITPSGDGGGYWMVASDGGVFSFGNAHFHGASPGNGDSTTVGLVRSLSGYRVVSADGTATDFP